MKKTTILLGFIAICSSAQDVIILKNGDIIKAKVTESAISQVKYLRYSDSTKKEYTIKNAEIRGVRYNATQYYGSSVQILASDKIFLANGDTLKANIQDVWGEIIRYKSGLLTNGVIYALSKTEVLGYEQNGSKIEISKAPEKPVVSAYASPSQSQSINSQSTTSTTQYKTSEKKENNTSWFVTAKVGGFIPVGDFGSDGQNVNVGAPAPNQNQNPYDQGNIGYAKPGVFAGIEGAYFVNKYVGFGTEFSYSTHAMKINTAGIAPNETFESKPWKLLMFMPGLYGRIPFERSYLDFKLCLAAISGVTEGYYYDDSFNYLALNPERFTALGLLIGMDYRVEISENWIASFGLDYLGTFSQKMVRLADIYTFDNKQLLSDIPIFRDISIQGARLNFGVGVNF